MSRDDMELPHADEELEGEQLLRELANVARQEANEEQPLDEAWEALCRGELDAAELEELEKLTPATQHDELDAFRPLSDEFRNNLVSQLGAKLQPQQPGIELEPAPPEAVESAAAKAGEKPVPSQPDDGSQAPLPFAGRRSATPKGSTRQWLVLAAVLALAFAWSLYTTRDDVALPGYVVEWTGGVDSQRSTSSAKPTTPRWAPGTELAIILRPERASVGVVFAHPFLLRQDQIHPWIGAPPEIAAAGSVRLRLGPGGALATGDWTILVVLGRSSLAPKIEDVLALLRANSTSFSDPSWTIWSQPIQVIDLS